MVEERDWKFHNKNAPVRELYFESLTPFDLRCQVGSRLYVYVCSRNKGTYKYGPSVYYYSDNLITSVDVTSTSRQMDILIITDGMSVAEGQIGMVRKCRYGSFVSFSLINQDFRYVITKETKPCRQDHKDMLHSIPIGHQKFRFYRSSSLSPLSSSPRQSAKPLYLKRTSSGAVVQYVP